MVIHVYETQEALDRAGAVLIAAELLRKPEAVLGLATGSSPLGIYKELTNLCKQGIISFKLAQTFNLDEYIGLPEGHVESYRSFMDRNLFGQVDVDRSATHFPNVRADNLDEAAEAYDRKIEEAGGIDLQLLGIGGNGHIGFNEPSDEFVDATHRVKLADATIEANSRFFESIDDVPKEAVSMGMGSIMKAKRIVLIATGEAKADAIAKMVKGDVTPDLPASILQRHDDVVVLLDKAAASGLSE